MALHMKSGGIGAAAFQGQQQQDRALSRDKAPPKRASTAKPLQFVTVTSTKQKNRKDVSKVVRTQAMRDYFWKQRNPDSSEAAASDLPMDPSQYKGRFRLNSPPNAAKAKAKAAAKKDKTRAKKANQVARVQKGRIGAARDRGPLLDIRFYLTDGLLEKIPPSMLGATLDPFDSFNLDMKPEALKLIWYYKQSYVKEFLELNVGGGYTLFDARENCALFHAILYLVALDYVLRRGFEDDLGCLYHSSEAFRLINNQIRSGKIEDSTIAAVAMISTKENLAGMFDISYIHMQGLKDMVQKRGGIDSIRGIHRGVVLWADFFNSTVFNCAPQFPTNFSPVIEEPPITPPESNPLSSPLETILNDELPVLLIIQSLRDVSEEKENYRSITQNNKEINNRIYDIEYKLHCLQRNNHEHGTSCGKMIPFCVALNIYLYLAIRELPVRSKLMMMLIDRLQETFNTEPMQWWISNQQQKNRILWMLFIGYAAGVDTYKDAWFFITIKTMCKNYKIHDMDQLKQNLKDVLWLDSWCDQYFDKLKVALEAPKVEP
ncbi:uncharacterized protein TrAFT101_000233 [Trichoderma asperellum]|uniref:Tachykinin family protein n=1 Tax=Trichoderma asperellum (strain ATCC 204424 / CBS 433.97 / NBRC 101777) TaxID=1042311 RepID=A0A2T3YUN4_TRIA4|nr:hypothetical protein M441DRAFT_285103 [Trichoderma asperellum CBS 433.97]PTB36265.1 hypothetical protein M441DRAFT_285103 [Trichoderma asperellum CBS 433.97]UKZ84320.1 hypothetical protein TrAFT101_000233 [Trichoderma asperellum]